MMAPNNFLMSLYYRKGGESSTCEDGKKSKGIFILKSKGGRMKKFFSVLVGLLLVTALASAHLYVTTAKTGTQEYFGVATRLLAPDGIKWVTGAVYKSGDYLKFYFTSGSGFTFPATAAGYFLVGRSRGDGLLHADLDGNFTNEWGLIGGGGGSAYTQFRITDAYPAYMNPLTSWFLTTNANPGATPGIIYVKAPIAPTATALGSAHKLNIDVNADGISGPVFDGTPASATFFTNYYEFTSVITNTNSRIDVALQRKGFEGLTYRSGGDKVDTTQDLSRDYDTGILGLLATDYFTHTVSGDMTGISYAKFYATTKTPGSGSVAVNVPATTANIFAGLNSAYLVVNGTTPLNNRTITDACAFAPASPGNGYYGRSLYAATTAWTWDTNGTVFRSTFFTTATLDGVYSAFRLANHAATGTPDAQVWADVWLDDGTKTTTSQLIGVIPAQGLLSLTGYAVAFNAGLAPSQTMSDAAWKGRVVFTVWSPVETTFGTQTTIMGGGYTEISLEKQMNANVAWWEK